MKILILSAAAIAAAAISPVFAQTEPAGQPMMHMKMQMQPVTRAAMVQKVQQHFAMVDADKDGFVTKAEMQAARASMHERMEQRMEKRGEAMFDHLDANHDGSISRQEFEAAHQTMAEGMGHHRGMGGKHGMRAMHAGMMGHMFEKADSNSDGRVSLQEATAAAAARFDKADLNHDGTLSVDEMRSAHKTMRAKSGRR